MDFDTRIAGLNTDGADYEIEISLNPPGMTVHVDGAAEFYPEEER